MFFRTSRKTRPLSPATGSKLKQIFKIYFKAALKIPKVSDIRWLSIELAVSRKVQHWKELKLHFCLAAT